jgi:hypothetical protein
MMPACPNHLETMTSSTHPMKPNTAQNAGMCSKPGVRVFLVHDVRERSRAAQKTVTADRLRKFCLPFHSGLASVAVRGQDAHDVAHHRRFASTDVATEDLFSGCGGLKFDDVAGACSWQDGFGELHEEVGVEAEDHGDRGGDAERDHHRERRFAVGFGVMSVHVGASAAAGALPKKA